MLQATIMRPTIGKRPIFLSCLKGSPPHPILTSIGRASHMRQPFSSLDNLEAELTARKLPILVDKLTQTPSRLLDATLADFLPSSPVTFNSDMKSGNDTSWNSWAFMRPGHHLVYFPPTAKLSELLPDGTDPDQSPGAPFVRRMWAGGHIRFGSPDGLIRRTFLNGQSTSVCLERISKINIKGAPNNEMIFVTIERCVSGSTIQQSRDSNGKIVESFPDNGIIGDENALRNTLPTSPQVQLVETRDIVFMKERTPGIALDSVKTRDRIVKSPFEPTRSHTLVPTAALLFRFSALTFNAHRIHLDKAYCQEVEGHRNLLVHGPLSLVLMLELLNRYLAEQGARVIRGHFTIPTQEILDISYRNISPLYAEEEMRLCLRDRSDGQFDLWVENRDGGLAVRATARTRSAGLNSQNQEPQILKD